MGQVEPVNYSNAALEQRRRGTNPAEVWEKYPFYRTKSIRDSCDSEAAHPYPLCPPLVSGVKMAACL